jgi:hypothetical protein
MITSAAAGSFSAKRFIARGRDARLLRLAGWLMIVYVMLQLGAVLRLIGVPDVAHVLLFAYRFIDLLLIGAFLFIWRGSIKVRVGDFIALLLVTYPVFISIARDQLNLTFFNDAAIYFSFVLKVVFFRTLIISILDRYELDVFFSKFSRIFLIVSASVAAVAFLVAQFFVASGQLLYYQSPAEITLAAAIAIASGNVGGIAFFLIFAALSGKRMLLVGVSAMLIFSLVFSRRLTTKLNRLLPIFFLSAVLGGFLILSTDRLEGLVFLEKLESTYEGAMRAFSNADSLDSFFLQLEPARYIEFVSLRENIDGWGAIFGNGYGFRYELNAALLADSGYEAEGDVTNAHFTPIAVVAKFGILGLFVWMAYFFSALTPLFRGKKERYFSYACGLALLGYLVQSLFAFGLFVNPITSFVLAVATVKRRANAMPTIRSKNI